MNYLYEIIKQAGSEKEFSKICEITFTEKELEMIEERWKIFSLLKKGYTQREAAKELNCSVVTVTRGAKAYRKYQKTIDSYLNTIV